jgi:hypothetical protein
MGEACGTYGREHSCIKDFVWKPKERDHLEDLGVDGRITSKWIFKKWIGGMDWTDLAQDRDR